MAQIDEKQEAIAKIRMAIDMDVAACARIDNEAAEAGISTTAVRMSESAWAAPNNVDGHSPHWIFGSPEKPIDSRILETDMRAQGNPSFKEFDERLRNFLSLCLPDEVIQYEDPILVSLNTHYRYYYLLLSFSTRSSYLNVSMSSTNQLKTGQKLVTFFDATTSFMAGNDMTVSFLKAALSCSFHG